MSLIIVDLLHTSGSSSLKISLNASRGWLLVALIDEECEQNLSSCVSSK